MRTVSLRAAVIILSLLMTGAAFGQEDETPLADINVSVIGVLQGSPGFTGQFTDTVGVTAVSGFFDFDLTMLPWKNGVAYLWLKAGRGDGIDADIPTLSMFNTTDVGSSLNLAELWYEHDFFNEKIRLRGGKIDITSAFDTNETANDEYNQFISGGFVNNQAVEFPDDSSFGAMLWISPNTFFDIGVGLADAAADMDNVFKNPFSIFELGVKPEIAGRPGNYRVYGWHNGKDHERLNSPDVVNDSNYGVGFSADQKISEDVTLFARYGRQYGGVSQIEHAWSAGLSVSGKFPRRGEDTLGLAYGQAVIGKDWKSLDPDTGMDSGSEHRIELYYSIKAGNYLNISPNLQWAKNPGGDRGNGGVWAFGIRAHFNLRNLNPLSQRAAQTRN